MLSKGEVEDRTLIKAASVVDLRSKIQKKDSVTERIVNEDHQLQEEQEVTVSHDTPYDSDSTVRVIKLLESFDDTKDSDLEHNQSPISRRSSRQYSSRGYSPRSTLSNSPYRYSPRKRYRSPSPKGGQQEGIFEGDVYHRVEYQSPTFRGSLDYSPRNIQHSSPKWNSPNKGYRATSPGYQEREQQTYRDLSYHTQRSLPSTTTSGEYYASKDYGNYHH